MTVELKTYIELRGDDPLDAVIAGTTRTKAYLVANLAFNETPEHAAEHYGLSLAAVHAAISFYYHNEEAIKQADEDLMAKLWANGMRDAREARKEIMRRQNQ